jgi:hypothetical protein
MVNIGLVNSGRNPMKSIQTKIHVLTFLCARCQHWPNDVELHNSSAQPTRATSVGSLAGSCVSTTLDLMSNSNAFGKYRPLVSRYVKYTQPVAASATQEFVSDLVKE